MSYQLRQQSVIYAPIDLVFELVSDPARLHEINPDITVTSHQPSPLGGHDTEWEYSFGAIKLTGRSQVVAYNAPHQLVIDTHGGIPSHWVWQFEAHNGDTQVSVALDYEVPGPLQFMGALLVKRNQQAVEAQMSNLKRLAETCILETD